jgi:hypothetical protein
VYLHHGAWWVYFREGKRAVRRKVAANRDEATQVAAQINAQLATCAPTLVAFTPTPIPQVRQEFLDHHELVLKSSLATIRRYRAATQHLDNFVQSQAKAPLAHQFPAETFVAYLRRIEVAPNGHPHSAPGWRFDDRATYFCASGAGVCAPLIG